MAEQRPKILGHVECKTKLQIKRIYFSKIIV